MKHFLKHSSAIFHCYYTKTNGMHLNDETLHLRKIRVSIESVNCYSMSYLLAVDKVVDQSSTSDSKQENCDIEDEEHIYDQVHNKYGLRFDMKLTQNKSHIEIHKHLCQWRLLYESRHTHCSLNIDHIEVHDTFEISLELPRYKINSRICKTK